MKPAGEPSSLTRLLTEAVRCMPVRVLAERRNPRFDATLLLSQALRAEDDSGLLFSTVTFDDEKTTVEALTQATTNAGYPSTLKQSQAKQE